MQNRTQASSKKVNKMEMMENGHAQKAEVALKCNLDCIKLLQVTR